MLNSETQNSGPAIGPTSSQIIEVFTLAQSGLVAVEDRLLSCFRSDAPELTTISTYLMQQGGKRIRPVLALLSARLFGMNEPSTALVDVAAGIELIHMATLLHDDIIDESPVRRHKRSAYLEFGLPPSLLTGDFLLVRAFGLCALLDDFVVQRTEQACVELVEGEILEGKLTPSNPASFPHYLNVVSKKTASLFALACELGGHQA